MATSSWPSAVIVVVGVLLLHWAALASPHVEARAHYHKYPRLIRGPWNILRGNNAGRLSISDLVYYVQVDIGPDLGELIAPINTTYSNNFGQTQLFAFNATEGVDPTSTQVGTLYGYTVEASYTSVTHGVEVEILVYDDGSVNGTVSIQGHVVNGATEVSIVGGTGDFRGASGYGLITFANSTGSRFIFRHELHFL